jgi:hypothetical protein
VDSSKMSSSNGGFSLEFELNSSKNQFFKTKVYRKWYPDIDEIVFEPK